MFREGVLKINRSIFHYSMRVSENPSGLGIKRGRIYELTLTRNGGTVYRYIKGLEIPEADRDTRLAVRLLLTEADGR